MLRQRALRLTHMDEIPRAIRLAVEQQLRITRQLDAIQPVLGAIELQRRATQPALAALAGQLDAMQPALAAMERQRQAMQPAIAAMERQLDALQPTLAAIEGQLDSVQPALAAMAQLIHEAQRDFFGQLRTIEPLFREFGRWALEVEEAVRSRKQHSALERDVSKKLSLLGWYISPDMVDEPLAQLAESIDSDPRIAIGKFMNYYQRKSNSIEKELVRDYPERKNILEDAFKAHREGRYNLSIPVFLSQSDGIFQDIFSKNLFIRPERQDFYSELFSEPGSWLFSGFLYPLSIATPMWMSEAERGKSFSDLNRHQVLHGESVDYGSQENSLKAISLLNYLRFIIEEYRSISDEN